MNKKRIELFSCILITLGIAFYYWILDNTFPGKRIILVVLLVLNVIGLAENIRSFKRYQKETYTTLMGYLASMGFIILVTVLAFLELVK